MPVQFETYNDPIELLEALMKERNLKGKDMAKILGVSWGMMSSIRHRNKGLSDKRLNIILKHFKLNVMLLVIRKEP